MRGALCWSTFAISARWDTDIPGGSRDVGTEGPTGTPEPRSLIEVELCSLEDILHRHFFVGVSAGTSGGDAEENEDR